MRRRRLVAGILALATVTAPGVRAGAEDAPLASFIGVMGALKQFNADVCDVEPPAAFDVAEIGRRALGRHAHDHSHAEVAAFGELVARRMLRWYSGTLHRERAAPPSAFPPDPIFGTGTAIGSWATITAITPGRRRSFVYHLRWAKEGSWRVYDIESNGRSRVRGYYTEFDRIILTEGYRVLMRRIRAEVDRDVAARRPAGSGPDGCRNAS